MNNRSQTGRPSVRGQHGDWPGLSPDSGRLYRHALFLTEQHMDRPSELKDQPPIAFRVQADRRQMDVLPDTAERRVKRGAAGSIHEHAGTIEDAADSATPDAAHDE